jgi:hypothetical protein
MRPDSTLRKPNESGFKPKLPQGIIPRSRAPIDWVGKRLPSPHTFKFLGPALSYQVSPKVAFELVLEFIWRHIAIRHIALELLQAIM